MKILAIEKELGRINWSAEQDTLKNEAHSIYQLYLTGYLREIYFNEQHCAVLILECENKDKAIELLDKLPLVERKLIQFELTVLSPYNGYERIMK